MKELPSPTCYTDCPIADTCARNIIHNPRPIKVHLYKIKHTSAGMGRFYCECDGFVSLKKLKEDDK